MVENLIDNRFALTYSKTIELVEKLFVKYAINIEIVKKDNFGMSFNISYKLNKLAHLILKSERGYINYDFLVNDKKVDLVSYEPLLSKIEVTSEKNIRLLINVISNYLKERKDN
jgi:hypothetical protein